MTWQRVRLELARSRDFPEGSTRHGYEMVLPLAPNRHIDRAVLEKDPELCTVHRFWEGEGDSVGQLVRNRGQWMISYASGDADDEPLHRFLNHRFSEGEYVSVRDAHGAEHAFRVVAVRPEPGLARAES